MQAFTFQDDVDNHGNADYRRDSVQREDFRARGENGNECTK